MSDDDGERQPTPLRKLNHAPGAMQSGRRRDPAPSLISPDELNHAQLDPVARLHDILDMVERAHDEYREAADFADGYGAGTLPVNTSTEEIIAGREKARGEVRKTYNRWFELIAHAKAAEAEVRRKKLEQPLAGQWAGEFERLRAELTTQYAGLGAHYDLLCDNAAATAVRLRQMESSGREYDSSEYIDMHKLHLSYVNQLQKYTEAMKSESINKQTQDVAEQLVAVFERHYGQNYPVEWSECVKEIRALVEGIGA